MVAVRQIDTNKLVLNMQKEDGSLCTGQSVPDVPEPRSKAAALLHGRTKLYLVGGIADPEPADAVDTVFMLDFDQEVKTWQVRSPMKTARKQPALGKYGDKIFVVGSFVDSTVEEYDTEADTWTLVADVVVPFIPNPNHEALQVADLLKVQ